MLRKICQYEVRDEVRQITKNIVHDIRHQNANWNRVNKNGTLISPKDAYCDWIIVEQHNR